MTERKNRRARGSSRPRKSAPGIGRVRELLGKYYPGGFSVRCPVALLSQSELFPTTTTIVDAVADIAEAVGVADVVVFVSSRISLKA